MTTLTLDAPARRRPSYSLFSALSTWHKARQTRKALQQLDDHLLRDIGIERGCIDAFTR